MSTVTMVKSPTALSQSSLLLKGTQSFTLRETGVPPVFGKERLLGLPDNMVCAFLRESQTFVI